MKSFQPNEIIVVSRAPKKWPLKKNSREGAKQYFSVFFVSAETCSSM